MNKTITFIKEKTNNFQPEIGIILGSGLGELADEYCDYAISYTEIPNFVKSTSIVCFPICSRFPG